MSGFVIEPANQEQQRQAEAMGLGVVFKIGLILLRYGPLLIHLIRTFGPLIKQAVDQLSRTSDTYGQQLKQLGDELADVLK